MPLDSNPLPSDRASLDDHIVAFEKWFMDQQRAHGIEATPLVSVEHAILRSYITWLRTTHAQDHDH